MIKKLIFRSFLILFLITSLSLFVPALYARYEIRNYLRFYTQQAVVHSDLEIKKTLVAFLASLGRHLEMTDLKIEREPILKISLSYQDDVCFQPASELICLFSIRATAVQQLEVTK